MVIIPIVGVYIPIIRIPIKGGMTIPNIATFDHGTYVSRLVTQGPKAFRIQCSSLPGLLEVHPISR